jgi:hypothetical protein
LQGLWLPGQPPWPSLMASPAFSWLLWPSLMASPAFSWLLWPSLMALALACGYATLCTGPYGVTWVFFFLVVYNVYPLLAGQTSKQKHQYLEL